VTLTAGVVVDASLGEHGIVLDLGLADRGAVAAHDDELGCEGKGEVWMTTVSQPLGADTTQRSHHARNTLDALRCCKAAADGLGRRPWLPPPPPPPPPRLGGELLCGSCGTGTIECAPLPERRVLRQVL
jgi:hypothetical protein